MELTLDQALQKGIEAHKAGKAQDADRYYTAILKANPKHPDANHNMGVLAVGIGKVQEALPFFKTALEANSNTAQFWLSYIDALIKLNRISDAQELFNAAQDAISNVDELQEVREKFKLILNLSNVIEKAESLSSQQHQALIDIFNNGKYKKLISRIEQLLEIHPKSEKLFNLQRCCSCEIKAI